MKLIYVASPLRGTKEETEENLRKAQLYCRFVIDQNCVPIAPHLMLDNLQTDDDAWEEGNERLMDACDEIWFFVSEEESRKKFGEWDSVGMNAEYKYATGKDMDCWVRKPNFDFDTYTEQLKDIWDSKPALPDYPQSPKDCDKVMCSKEWAQEHFSNEAVNHPSHYTFGKYETIDVIEDMLTEEEFRGYCKGNAIKYIYRCDHKGGDIDLQKASWYLGRLSTAPEDINAQEKE